MDMNTYGQYCPVAKGSEIIADRWTPLILRELLADIHRFSDLQRGLPGISRSLLVNRLRRLEAAGVLERRPGPGGRHLEYHLTAAGWALRPVVMELGEWAARWAFGDPEPAELKPEVLMGWMTRRVNRELLPDRRIVVRFDLERTTKRWWWLVMQPNDISVCRTDPRFDADLLVRAGLDDLYRLWLGRITFGAARAQNLVQIEGPSSLVRAFPSWMALSPLAPAVRAGASRSSSLTATGR
jgi:DNA-binding HxlR family transcriptional regulator